MPTISVVTISYNQAHYLRRAIESVLSQTGVDVDYIVVDPGSTDGSREIVEEYRDRLSAVVFDSDRGPADGLNKGLALARGEIFYYINSDDEVMPGAFSDVIEQWEAHPEVDVLFGNGIIIGADGEKIRPVYSAQRFTSRLYARGLAAIVQQAAFIRTSALRSVGGFNVGNKTSWDGEAFFAMARAGAKFRRVWRSWGKFRVYPGTISGSGRLEVQAKLDHERMWHIEFGRVESPLQRIATRLIWIGLRIADVRRWSSYFRGPLRPAIIASGGATSGGENAQT